MPPWLPKPQDIKFADERRLSDQQIALFQRWVDQGAIEGNAADLPRRPHFEEGWQLGSPDLIIRAEKPYRLAASGTDTYWNFILQVPLERTRWVKAAEIRPGDKRLVHHANLLIDRMGTAREREQEPGAGFPGMDLSLENEAFDPDSHLLFWKPGTVPYVESNGMALRLDKGTDLVLNTHLHSSGKAEMIQPAVGLYFTDVPATMHPMLMQMEADSQLDIPPGEKNFAVSDDFQLPVDVDVLAIYPHAHYLGKELLAFATLPDGTRKTLIHISHWDLNWQAVYRYAEAVALPAGATISMRYTYDNSANNVANPNHPPKRVRMGNAASDEMAHLWLQVLAKNGPGAQRDARMILQEELARHLIEKNPADFAAHYNLAAMLLVKGNSREAIGEYQAALRIRPEDAVVNNALGAALLATGQVHDAIEHFKSALRARPRYFDAHYNLGLALASRGDFRSAVDHLEAAVLLNPADANAEANLGSALAEEGRVAEAKIHFWRALEINPHQAQAEENLKLLH
jgi:tetratricopeptide (TPR) repeat protein